MSITYCEERKLFTLETRQTTYQMKVDACGCLRHLYYGRSAAGDDFSYLQRDYDRGFSGNPHAFGGDRTVSLDTMPAGKLPRLFSFQRVFVLTHGRFAAII